MPQRHFDMDYIEEVTALLKKLPEDTVPRWGKLRRGTLIEHLIWSVRQAMGRSNHVPYIGNWVTRAVVKPVFLSGVFAIPKNLPLPAKLRKQNIELRESGDLETLHALLEEYAGLVQADELQPGMHPLFGPMSIDDWDRLLVLHFEHHLKQFALR